jgi:hypothetical protein
MSQYRDLIARMAVDAEFAAYARAHPDEVSTRYGLTLDETQQLRGLADAAASAGPTALGARLSKSGISTGLLGGFMVGHPEIIEVNDHYKPAIEPQPSSGVEEAGQPNLPDKYLENIFGNHTLEVLQEDDDQPKPPPQVTDHIGPLDLIEVLPPFPDEEPLPPPLTDPGLPPPVTPPADPVTPPAPPPTPPPAPAVDPVNNPATPTAPASPVTDVTSPPADGADPGESGAPLQVGAPTTDTPGGAATPPSAFTAESDSAGDSGIGVTEIAIGGAGLVVGAVAGGVAGALAGKSLGSSAADPNDEKTMQGLGPATA